MINFEEQLKAVAYLPPKNPKRVSTRVTPTAAKLLMYYLGLCRPGHPPKFRVSLKTISKATGIPVRTISSANECLKQMSILDWNRGHGFGDSKWASEYWLIWDTIGMMREMIRRERGY
jgi:hypothetical protein